MRRIVFTDEPPGGWGTVDLMPCPVVRKGVRCGRRRSVCPECERSIDRCVARRGRDERYGRTGQHEMEM